MELPRAVMEKLLKAAGAKRISENAKNELDILLERKIQEVSGKAIVLSKHAGRKTIKKEDISILIRP
jgi:histone H3/H4